MAPATGAAEQLDRLPEDDNGSALRATTAPGRAPRARLGGLALSSAPRAEAIDASVPGRSRRRSRRCPIGATPERLVGDVEGAVDDRRSPRPARPR